MSTRQFGDLTIPTAEASYEDGRATGRAWRDPYTPGGPCAFHVNHSDEPWFRAYCAATVENRREWQRGFQDGRRAA